MRANASGNSRARGFTLIEVLAALVIVALGMMGVIEAVTQSVRNGTYLREKTLAHWVAMNVITERRLAASPPEIGKTSDEIELAGVRWKWELVTTQTQLESMRRMDVSVRLASTAEGSALANVSGFYGTAIGASGGGALTWAGTGGTQPGGVQGGGTNGNNPGGSNPPPGLPTDTEE
ncbi:MAG TPA: type II secretion system minor pseudopilin GspI [Steroidobacteraceae bacterium]